MKQNHVIALSTMLLIMACKQENDNKNNTSTLPQQTNYVLGEVTQKPLSSAIQLPGELLPFEFVNLFPKVNGFVKDVFVDRGSTVRKGQVLLQLEAPEIEQQYYAAKSKYLQAYSLFMASKDNYERMLETSKTPGTISAHDLELAHAKMMADSATVDGEKANYKAYEAMKNYLTVVAPFDGVITERNVHPGALVGPNLKADDKPMLVLEQEAKLRLTVSIPEMYSGQLSSRGKVKFHVSVLPGKTFEGTISREAGSLNLKYRSEAIEIDVNNKSGLLKPGMFAEVEIPIEGNRSALVVPKSAVVTSTEKKYVIAVNNHKTKWVDVQVGNVRNDSTEIFGSIPSHSKIIVNASDEIKEGIDLQ